MNEIFGNWESGGSQFPKIRLIRPSRVPNTSTVLGATNRVFSRIQPHHRLWDYRFH
jgi:hypothetical protein